MEQWKSIEGYGGMYEVSDLGRVRSWKNGRHGMAATPKFLALWPNGNGYLMVSLCQKQKVKPVGVHILVLETFTGHHPKGMQVCHGRQNHYDGTQTDKADNRLCNLEWGTRSKNRGEDQRRDGVLQNGELGPNAKLTDERAGIIRQDYASGNYRQWELALRENVSQTTISNVVNHRTFAV